MPKVTLELSTKRVKELDFQLPPSDFMSLASEVTERAETLAMMQVTESGFAEWNESGEDIYDETTTQ